MTDDWIPSDEETEAWLEEWAAVDRAAADYLAERLPQVLEPVSQDDERWLDSVIETFSPGDPPGEESLEGLSAAMALDHTDWLALALGVSRRGTGHPLDADQVMADLQALDDVEGEVEDPEGTRGVIGMALLFLTRPWQELGMLDADERLTPRGVWGIPRALHRSWVG